MDERKWADQFSRQLDLRGGAGKPLSPDESAPQVQEALEMAEALARLDVSDESRVRASLRARLLARDTGQKQPASGRQIAWPSLASAARITGLAVLILGLTFGLSWSIRRLLPLNRPVPLFIAEPPIATQELAIVQESGPATGSQQESLTATPTPLPPPGGDLLRVDTPTEFIRDRIHNPRWQSLWVQGRADFIGADSSQQAFHVQAWLKRDGTGRVLSSDAVPAGFGFNLDIDPRWIWISDGLTLNLFDKQTGGFDPSTGRMQWSTHPLEMAGPVSEMLFPSFLETISSDVQPVEMGEQAGRMALVAEWAGRRFWVDAETGVLLRQQTLGQDGQVTEDVAIQAILYNPEPPALDLNSDQLETMAFEPLPDQVSVALSVPDLTEPPLALTEAPQATEPLFTYVVQEGDTLLKIADEFGVPVASIFELNNLPAEGGILSPGLALLIPQPAITLTPTPTPFPPPGEGESIYISPVDGPLDPPVEDGKAGQLYFTLRSVVAPITRRLARLDLGCLYTQEECTAEVLSGFPRASDDPLSWSPDSQRAVLVDLNNTRLLAFDPRDASWDTLVKELYATMSLALWSPDGAWIALTVQGEDENSSLITLVNPSDPQAVSMRTMARELGGMQVPLGWIDAQTLLFQRFYSEPKGSGSTESGPPVLYSLNVESGQVTELPFDGAWDWLSDYPALSADGDNLAVTDSSGGRSGLVVIDLANMQVTQLGVTGVRPARSPDGRWIAYTGSNGSGYQVSIVQPDGLGVQQVFESASFPSTYWTPDSQHLLIVVYPQSDDRLLDRTTFYLVDVGQGTKKKMVLSADELQEEFIAPSFRPAPDS
jgi:LysM repeat protein